MAGSPRESVSGRECQYGILPYGNSVHTTVRRGGMGYLQENALAKVVEGITSIKEVYRASQKRARTQRR